MTTRKLRLGSPQEAIHLFGEQDTLLREMERDFGVEMFLRQDVQSAELTLSIKGAAARVEKAAKRVRERLASLRDDAETGHEMRGLQPTSLGQPPVPEDAVFRTAFGKLVKPRTPNQKLYVDAVRSHDLTFGIGPAGTGKTFLAVACALRALESQQVHRIIISRPVVEAGEKLGFLPGDMLEKVSPYLRPIYDAFFNMLGPERFRLWRDTEVVEIVPLAYMRGRTFEDAFIILDEAQNTTPEQMKMFLTRMGMGSKAVVTGDITQNDLGERATSGLVRIAEVLRGVEGVAFHLLTEHDVVRHPLVRRIIRAYDQWSGPR